MNSNPKFRFTDEPDKLITVEELKQAVLEDPPCDDHMTVFGYLARSGGALIRLEVLMPGERNWQQVNLRTTKVHQGGELTGLIYQICPLNAVGQRITYDGETLSFEVPGYAACPTT